MRVMDRAVIDVARTKQRPVNLRARMNRATWDHPVVVCGAMLLGIALLDAMTNLGGAGRMLYLLPVWWIAERHGYLAAAVACLLGLPIHSFVTHGTESFSVGAALLQATLGLALAYRVARAARLTQMAMHRAGHDPLTGVANRMNIEFFADRELGKCVRDGRDFTVGLIDCDKFKSLNDVHGHAYGDQILKILTESVEDEIRGLGKIGRIGGDEFLVVFPGCSIERANGCLDRASRKFSDRTLSRGGRATISVGVASTSDTIYLRRLIESADDDMYRRKAAKHAKFETLA